MRTPAGYASPLNGGEPRLRVRLSTSSVSEPSLRQLVGRLCYRQLGLLVGIGNVASAQRRPPRSVWMKRSALP